MPDALEIDALETDALETDALVGRAGCPEQLRCKPRRDRYPVRLGRGDMPVATTIASRTFSPEDVLMVPAVRRQILFIPPETGRLLQEKLTLPLDTAAVHSGRSVGLLWARPRRDTRGSTGLGVGGADAGRFSGLLRTIASFTESTDQWNAYGSLILERLRGYQPGSAARKATDKSTFDPADMERERTALFIMGTMCSDMSRAFVGSMAAAVIERFVEAHGPLRALVVGEEWGQLYVSNFYAILDPVPARRDQFPRRVSERERADRG